MSHGNTVRQILHDRFEPSDVKDLDGIQLRQIAELVDREVPQLISLIFAVQAILAGLAASSETQYRLNLTSATQKLIAMLTFETCVALENFHRVKTEGRVSAKYIFSPLLSPKK